MPRPKLQNAWAVLLCGAGPQTASQEVTQSILPLNLSSFTFLEAWFSQAWEMQCCFMVGSGSDCLGSSPCPSSTDSVPGRLSDPSGYWLSVHPGRLSGLGDLTHLS